MWDLSMLLAGSAEWRMVPGSVVLSMRPILIDPYAAFSVQHPSRARAGHAELLIEDEQYIVETALSRIANPIESHDINFLKRRSVPASCDNFKMSAKFLCHLRTASMGVSCRRRTGGSPTFGAAPAVTGGLSSPLA
jgi:hypothetical protein